MFKIKYKAISLLIGLIVAILFGFLRVAAYHFAYKYIIQAPASELITDDWEIYGEIRGAIVASIYALLIKFTVDWFRSQKQQSELITQNQTSELALLRSQVNPHFLFNTLNNIYSLVYQKSEDAPNAVMKLSSIMRYMLYDANTDKVLLSKEIEYLNSFIELQKLRFKSKDFVEIKIIGNVENQLIAPMLLIPFIENAFKHGNKKVDSPGIIINIHAMTNKIVYEIINYLSEGNIKKDDTGGIGLNNTKRRLELLYHMNHKLNIVQTNDKYIVNFEIYI